MNPLVLAGLGGGLIALGAWYLLLPRLSRPPLSELLTDPRPDVQTSTPSKRPRLATTAIPLLGALGLPGERTRHRLAMCDQTVPDYLAKKAAALLGALAGPLVLLPILMALGIGVALPLTVWALFALMLWMAPDTELRKRADQRTTQMRHAISALCDLVVIALAGGAGVNEALSAATRNTRSWPMSRIRSELTTAAIQHQPPEVALRRIGQTYQVRAATELASSLRQAGNDGARVRRSLAAKARTARTQHLRHLEGEGHATTERMSLPLTVIFAGYLLLIGYPAVSLIMTTLP